MRNNYTKKYSAVAGIYDAYVNTAYDFDFWIKECSKEKEVLEITSGTGRVTIPLAKAGIKVTAVDISKELLAILRKKCIKEKLKVEIHEADMRNFKLDRKFPLIIIPFQSLQELTSPKDHVACFRQVYNHLAKGGRFIVTTHNTQQDSDLSQLRLLGEFIHPKTRNRILLWISRKLDPKTNIWTAYQFYDEYDKKDMLISKKQFRNEYYIFGNGELERLAKKTGFKIKNVYGDYTHGKLDARSSFRIYELTR